MRTYSFLVCHSAHVTLDKSYLELILSEFHKEKLIGKIGTYFKNSYPEVFIVENSLLILTQLLFVENHLSFAPLSSMIKCFSEELEATLSFFPS